MSGDGLESHAGPCQVHSSLNCSMLGLKLAVFSCQLKAFRFEHGMQQEEIAHLQRRISLAFHTVCRAILDSECSVWVKWLIEPTDRMVKTATA